MVAQNCAKRIIAPHKLNAFSGTITSYDNAKLDRLCIVHHIERKKNKLSDVN